MEEEAVMSGGGVEEVKEVAERDSCGVAAGGGSGGVVKWEKFMPRMTMRVLLVEADDSTRQVVGALLRKCGYRVTAVPDGLKAWEILKGKPHNLDLVLTEVELPSISGFALLSLVSEHDVCKNIPVIMMSKLDSMNLVYKCMLRGAADYLVKPIRRNELQNLWQHVWRRQTSTVDGNGIQDESVAQQKMEATAENNSEAIESSGHIASAQRENEIIEKGSDTQSSCTTPVLEAETENLNELQDFPQPIEQVPNNTNDTRIKVPENCPTPSQELLLMQGDNAGIRKEVEPEVDKKNPNVATEDFGNNNVGFNSYKVAIDLIGAFDKYQNGNVMYPQSHRGARKVDLSLKLDLSLKRSDPCGLDGETNTINHSDASAFSRYIGKSSQPCPVIAVSTSLAHQQKEYGSAEKDTPYLINSYHSGTPSPALSTPKSILSLANSQTKQSGYAFPYLQQGVYPASVPPGRMNGSSNNDFGSIIRRAYCVQSGQTPMPSPSNACRQESFPGDSSDQSICQTNNMEHQYPLEQNSMSSPNLSRQKQQLRFDALNHQEQFSSATDKSGSSSLHDGTLTRLNSMDCGSICESSGNVNHISVSRMEKESNVEGCYITIDGNSQRSIQREAALTKFRLKRKDRNFEKKVRYESRKKLAEQRPRVKGQFVRQIPVGPVPQENH